MKERNDEASESLRPLAEGSPTSKISPDETSKISEGSREGLAPSCTIEGCLNTPRWCEAHAEPPGPRPGGAGRGQ